MLVTMKQLIKQLQPEFDLSPNKIRRWTEAGILILAEIDEDGKSFLYHIDCVRVRLAVFKRVRLKYRKESLKGIGEKFKEVFGGEEDEDENLKRDLEKSRKMDNVIKKYVNEVSSTE